MNNWNDILKKEFKKEYFIELLKLVDYERNTHVIYPKKKDIFKAFDLCKLSDIKVVIIAQDPYHGLNQANGLAFSVNKGVKLPPSLVNIFKEIKRDLGINNTNGDLSKWAKQGVLLLNSTLTVRKDEANSHKDIGWQIFTDNIIKFLSNINRPMVFMLWGAFAQKKAKYIKKHLILKTSHPSPLSVYRGFSGSSHFSKANDFLVNNKMEKIDWRT